MIKIGSYNTLRIERFVDFGAYLVDPTESQKKLSAENTDHPGEVLIPRRYLTDDMVVGDTVKVFVYTDSEDRPVATTEKPYATVGEFAFCRLCRLIASALSLIGDCRKTYWFPLRNRR